MLTTLRIKNLALVPDLTLTLQPGLNIISGETGAGKSILIGALTLVLGQRADRTLIRGGSNSCTVEAVFDISQIKSPLPALLEAAGLEPCEDDQLLLKRTVSSSGANRQFVNGSPTSLATLASIGQWLVDIHGPHDHQSLLHPARQLAILDAFGNLESTRAEFTELTRERARIEAAKADLVVDEQTYARQLDLLRFQVDEITHARFEPDEEGRLEQEYQRASNGAKLLQLAQTAVTFLDEDDQSLLNLAGALGRTLQELAQLDANTEGLLATHQQAVADLQELRSELSRYTDGIDTDPRRLMELEERINLLHSLKRKYGATLGQVIEFGQAAHEQLQQLEQRDEQLTRLNQKLAALEERLWTCGAQLSAKRQSLTQRLNRAVSKELASLGFKQSHFEAALSSAGPHSTPASQLSASGIDTVEFLFSPNPGEPKRPLRAIASSGEIARVMLGLKTVLAAQDQIPLLVFDEVDANIGGQTASVVGEKMKQIARNRQVLCITHLAPVAAHAQAHYLVTKEVKAGRTESTIALLPKPDRIAELARMLGGPTAAAQKHATELLKRPTSGS